MSKTGNVFIQDNLVGEIRKDDDGFHFKYLETYINNPIHGPVSRTLPVREQAYHNDKTLFPFFDGLIPEGWLLDITVKNWKLDEKDRMELLLTVCEDCIGAVKVIRKKEKA
jgi:serine/threonine-protein kinase HipA